MVILKKRGTKKIKSFILFILIMALGIWLYTYYSVRDIHLKYQGIKYQISDPTKEKPATMEINGKLNINLFSSLDEFYGTIKVDDKDFAYSDFVHKETGFREIPLLSPSSPKEPYGKVFYDGAFKKVIVEIYEQKGDLKYSWDRYNGYLIAAPCKSRKEAVDLSYNMLVYVYPSFTIKK